MSDLAPVRRRVALLARYDDAAFDAQVVIPAKLGALLAPVDDACARYLAGAADELKRQRERRYLEMWGAVLGPDPAPAPVRDVLRDLSDASRAIAAAHASRVVMDKRNRAARRKAAAKGRTQ